jgi:hypothetical protein
MENFKHWMEQKLTSEDMDKLPNASKALSKEQLIKILEDEKWNLDDPAHLISLMRAVERAHGIS